MIQQIIDGVLECLALVSIVSLAVVVMLLLGG
jgi:hypothetical protein